MHVIRKATATAALLISGLVMSPAPAVAIDTDVAGVVSPRDSQTGLPPGQVVSPRDTSSGSAAGRKG